MIGHHALRPRIGEWLFAATFILICLAAVVATALGITCHLGSPGSGESVGTVVNVAHHGIIWDPPQVYLLHAGEMKSEEFAVEPDLAPQLEGYAESGARIRVHYTEYMLCARWHYSSCTVIDSVRPEPAAVKP